MRFYKCTYYVKTTFTLNKKWGNYDMGFVSATTVSLGNYGIRFIKKIENQDKHVDASINWKCIYGSTLKHINTDNFKPIVTYGNLKSSFYKV